MKYAVITYIFGNYEKLREIRVKDPNTEYICVTDQNLHSRTWKIIHDTVPLADTNRDKVVYVKFNPFKYTNAQYICVIDGSIEIKHSLKHLFEQLKTTDLLVKKHPRHSTLIEELKAWVNVRKMPQVCVDKFISAAKTLNYDLNTNFLIEGCIICYNANENAKYLCKVLIEFMKLLGTDGNLIMTNQCPLSLLLKTLCNDVKYSFLNQNTYFIRYKHNSNTCLME